MNFENLGLVELILLGLFALTVIIQLGFYWVLFSKLAFFKNKKQKKDENGLPPVSVVIAARNEYYNLKDNLPYILEQEYTDFEVVVVNHASSDDTSYLLRELSVKYNNLKAVELSQDLNFFKGKKFPLSIGIREAKNDVLLLTDADCRPASKNWIKEMASNYDSSTTEVVLGYGPFEKEKGFVNLLSRYDNFTVALQYLSMALAGKPYMGVGRNLSYRKELFYRSKGFISHYNIPSGDDDLFISTVADKRNTKVELSDSSFVYSKAKNSFSEWFRQKKRHLTTSSKYKPSVKFLLGLFSFTQLLFFALFISLIVLKVEPLLVTGLFALRFITAVIINKKVSILFKEKKLCAFTIIWEPFHLLLLITVAIASKFTKNKTW